MNNLGFSIDNLHIGDVRIKGQDETLIIGNENGGPGYILPEQKGTEGQVITMNADNTTSFQDGGGSGNVLLGAGLGDDITVPYNSPALPLPSSFVGTQRVTYGQLPIGGSIKYYLNSRFNLDIPSAGSVVDAVKISMTTTAYRANGTFAGIDAAIVNNNAILDSSSPLSLPINFKGYLKVEGYITRTSSDTITLTSTAFSKEYPPTKLNCQQWENQAQPEEITISSPQPDDYIEFLWEIRNDYFTTGTISLIRPSIYWALQNVSDATVPPTLTSDHTQLTNLNLGDAGHTQFALLQGRAGGQVLSGGITPANFLTLKSHTAGLNNLIVKDLNTSFEKNIDIGTNQILDGVNNSIDFIGGDMTLLNTSLTNRIVIASQNEIDVLANSQIKLGVPNASNNIVITSTDTSLNQALNMNNNNINDVLNINSASSIILNPAPASVVDINGNVDMGSNNIIGVSEVVGDGGDLTIRNGGGESILLNSATNTVDILNNNLNMNTNDILNAGDVALTSINTSVIYVPEGAMPSSFVADRTYIFLGSRTTATSFTLPANCKICGTGKNNSFINYTGAGSLFVSTDNNLSICEITLTSSDNAGRILSGINLGQDKTIDMTKVQLRNCKNGMTIVGYDLVDLNNCIFTFFESGSLTPIGINFNDNSKVQLSSCEFLRWFQEGGVPGSTFFNGIMLKFAGALNALNINGCFFHPQYDQDGINLSALLSAIEGTITSNTFIDINLNTPTFQVLVPPIASLASKYVIESNSIYPNLKSQVTYVLSAVNTTATDLSVNNPNVINHNNLALPLAIQFATITPGGLITYTKKRSANFMIVATCNLELVAGTDNRIGLGLFVNGAEVPLAYSFVNLSASGNANQKSVTLSFTGQANLNDTFQLSIFNSTASNNVIVNDVNFAGIEI